MKKFLALALAFIMVFALATTAFAATDNDNKTIEIHNIETDQTYTAYKIFDMTVIGSDSENPDSFTGYAYTISSTVADGEDDGTEPDVNPVWTAVLSYMGNPEGENGVFTGAGITLTPTTENGKYAVAVKTEKASEEDTDPLFSASAFAAHLNNCKDNLTAAGSTTPLPTSNVATITVTGAGYYFIDSSLGSLCALDSADDGVVVYEKNTQPGIGKEVWEDSTGSWEDKATADITQEVKFKLTVNTGTINASVDTDADETTLGTGVDDDYVITDTLPAGMTLKSGTIKVSTVNVDDETGETTTTEWANSNYSSEYKYEAAVEADPENNVEAKAEVNTLKITLESAGLQGLAQNTDIEIEYTATVDADAVIAGDGNVNSAYVTYKEENSLNATATVYTWDLPVFKYTVTIEDDPDTTADETVKTGLAGAKFKLYKEVQGTSAKDEEGNSIQEAVKMYAKTGVVAEGGVYTLTGWTADETQATEFVSPEGGKFTIRGLDSDTYQLIETEAPAGYNALIEPVQVVIGEEGALNPKYEDQTQTDNEGKETTVTVLTESEEQIEVENKSGTELPSTGGMGTTVFYIIGAVLMLGAVVVLVSRKRMAA